MSQEPGWEEAAAFFKKGNFVDSKGVLTIGEICHFIANSSYRHDLKIVDTLLETGQDRIYISRSDGRFPEKRLKIMAITGGRLEICIGDRQTGAERCWFPHVEAEKGLERLQKILSTLNWSKKVVDDNSFEASIRRMFGMR